MALNLYNSLNLIFLADQMIDDIKNCWNEPFNAPTVIFPDFFVEDWFKRYWIKNNRSVLMNLRTCRLDSYLFDILKPENQNIKNLSQDMLQLMLIKELSQPSGSYGRTCIKAKPLQEQGYPSLAQRHHRQAFLPFPLQTHPVLADPQG